MSNPIACYLALAVAFIAPLSQAADWPQWGGRDARNFVADETGLPASFHPDRTEVSNSLTTLILGENLKWSAPLGTQAYVTPAISKGKIFIPLKLITCLWRPKMNKKPS